MTLDAWPFPTHAIPALEPIDEFEERARAQLAYQLNLGLKIIVATQAIRRPRDFQTGKAGELLAELAAGYVDGARLRVCSIHQPFEVLRETDYEEWIANAPPNIPGPMPRKAAAIAGGFRFYEVTTD